MPITDDIKNKLSESTEKIEKKVKELWDQNSPHYTNLEPWKRGLILLGLSLGTIVIIYWLTSSNKSNNREELEAQAEERLIRRMGVLKKLRD